MRTLMNSFRHFFLVVYLLSLASCVLPKNENLSQTILQEMNQDNGASKEFAGLASAQTISATKVQLSWIPSTNPDVIGYAVYDTSLAFNPKLIKTVKAPAEGVAITNLSPQTFYSFRVNAFKKDQVNDPNKVDIGAIPYGGISSVDVQSSTTAVFKYADGSNADKILVYCKVGLLAVEESLIATITNTTNSQSLISDLKAGETYKCRVVLDIGGFQDNNTTAVTFIPLGQATQLVFASQPTSGSAGVAIPGQPVVSIRDSSGNVIVAGPDSSAQVTLTIAPPGAGVVVGTSTVTAVKGVATFTGLSFQEAGIKSLRATKSDTSNQTNGSAPLTIDSDSFTISPGPVDATKSSISISPAVPPATALVADGNASYSVIITLKDQFNNPISGIKPTFASSISGDNLSQPSAFTDSTGSSSGSISSTIADTSSPFRSLTISSPAGLGTLSVLAPLVPGVATKLGYVVQPVNSPGGALGMAPIQIAVMDANSNVVNTGAASTSSINVSIASNVNGAVLSGTTTATAVNGIASFNNLGIDKTATGYKLLASSGSYIPSYSNSFNITSGTPQKITVTSGSNTVVSNVCSGVITVQLKDNGNNPANAIQNTPVSISGLGSGSLYTSSTCSGSPISSTLTFAAATNTKNLYLKSLASETLNLVFSDTSSVLTTGTFTMNVLPNKISITANMPSPPAVSGTPMSVVAGACSPAIVVTPRGENGNPGPLPAITGVSITGLNGTSAQIFSDSACTQLLTASNVSLPITAGTGTYPINIYLKDPKSEVLNLNVTDNAAVMASISSNQQISILPSKIIFSGPSTVVAGRCSTAYTVSLKDEQNNLVNADTNKTININGLNGTITGAFYNTNTCSDSPMNTQLVIPQGSSSIIVYFKDTTAESLTVFMSDPDSLMANSSSISIGISPAAFQITGPTPANSKTTVCAGPFTVNTLDGAIVPNITAAINTIVANLTQSGYAAGFIDAGKFYSDSLCSSEITSLTFNTGNSAKNFYFKGQYPAASLTLTASDGAAVLNSGTTNWTIIGEKGWIGTLGSFLDSAGEILWFRTGVSPVSARMDAPSTIRDLTFDASKNFLYTVDESGHRIIKYDYVNQRYVGWIGGFTNPNNAAALISGSKKSLYPALPSSASCIATTSGSVTPGWCLGGQSIASSNSTSGILYNPRQLTVDSNYIYITNYYSNIVTRYDANSGTFAGWVGGISSTPTGIGPGGPGSCTSTSSGITPGWCKGGNNAGNASGTSTWGYGNGYMYNPNAIANDGTYLYVGTNGAILRFNLASGAFAGWIGKAYTTQPTSGASGCTSLSSGTTTPGWCYGGTYQSVNPNTATGTGSLRGGISFPRSIYIKDGYLYVLHSDSSGTITYYNASTGAFIDRLPSLAFNWNGAIDFVFDTITNLFYVADTSRVIAVDTDGLVNGWLGKVNNTSSLTSALGYTGDCSVLGTNDNTPGWCLGGSAKSGMDEQAFEETYSIENDGNGNLLVGNYRTALIKKYNMTTGAYLGSLGYSSTAPQEWSNDATTEAELYGFGNDDFYYPLGGYSDGTYLYVSDWGNGRVKKISLATGKLVGWIGGVTTTPTGGPHSGCVTTNPMSVTPGWCTGALGNPWYHILNFTGSSQINGLMRVPNGVTGDGTYIYVVDQGLHRISKFNASTGVFVGWVGNIANSPTGGATGCVGATIGTFTPGWCTGGLSDSGTGDGMLNYPSAITYVAATGKLYVVDNLNHRISSYNASTGAFTGWIGRIGSAPSGGCSTISNGSYNVSTGGWCTGGTSAEASGSGDKFGGFRFYHCTSCSPLSAFGYPGGITSDGTNLYVSNFYNFRIDKISLAGTWQSAVLSRWDQYTNTWQSNGAVVGGWNPGCEYPMGLWTDGTNLYGTGYSMCGYSQAGVAVWKMDLSSGNMIGWQGGVMPAVSIVGGDTGCVGASSKTPGWCQGGAAMQGFKLGQFSNAYYVTGETSGSYIYVIDSNTNRVTRMLK